MTGFLDHFANSPLPLTGKPRRLRQRAGLDTDTELSAAHMSRYIEHPKFLTGRKRLRKCDLTLLFRAPSMRMGPKLSDLFQSFMPGTSLLISSCHQSPLLTSSSKLFLMFIADISSLPARPAGVHAERSLEPEVFPISFDFLLFLLLFSLFIFVILIIIRGRHKPHHGARALTGRATRP